MRALPAAALALALLASRASAQPFPARTGETGLLDVPDGQVAGAGGGQAAAELRFDHAEGRRDAYGPLPLYAVGGVTDQLDVGLTLRESGQPGDVQPSRGVVGAALKLQLAGPSGAFEGGAIGAVLDRINGRMVGGARLALSAHLAPLRVAAFAGGEAEASGFGNGGFTAGVAAAAQLARGIDLAAEALTGPRGANVGGALRWYRAETFGVALGGNYFPGDHAYRIAVTLAFGQATVKRAAPPPIAEAPAAPGQAAASATFLDDRPHFRLRFPTADGLAAQTHLHGGAAPAAAATPERSLAQARPAAPSLQDLAEAQLKEKVALAETRAARIQTATEQLDARERAALDEQRRLEARERDLGARQAQLEARERLLLAKAPPTQQQRQLESVEAQLASEERNLSAQERSYAPALDAAQGRARDAAERADAEKKEATRLATAAGAASSHEQAAELRKQAIGATSRQLAALDAVLAARGEYVDALERQLRTRSDRLDASSRRLDTRTERVELAENASRPAAPSAAPKAGGTAPEPKGKAAFVTVVKSPTAVMKEPAAPAGAPAPSTRPAAATEKTVAAATVVMFPAPTTQLSELDLEALANLAKLAARERYEIMVWARAQDPGALAEAQRRAAEIQTRLLAAAPLDANRLVVRITVRPGAKGVDVVVSALRDNAKPAAAQAGTQAPRLLPGESGNRQLREAVQAAQGSIEGCVGDHLRSRRLERVEGALKITISSQGRVTAIGTAGDLASEQLQACLRTASSAWQFPTADGEYVVDVPITVMPGGAAR